MKDCVAGNSESFCSFLHHRFINSADDRWRECRNKHNNLYSCS